MYYQQIYVKGNPNTTPYQRDCESRYAVVKKLFDYFKRPFSILDIGANYGYFCLRACREYDCHAVAIDNKPIVNLIEENEVQDRMVWISTHVSAGNLYQLSTCETFDVVLGLSVLHHFKDPVVAFNAMSRLGTFSVFEIPGRDDISAANPERHQVIQELFHGKQPIAHFPSHVSDTLRPMYILQNRPFIELQRLDAADDNVTLGNKYNIVQDFEQSRIVIERRRYGLEERDFIPGMNLYNFMRMGGGFPSNEWIKEEMQKYKEGHGDYQPWNFVINGKIHPIDTHDKDLIPEEPNKFFEEEGLL